MSLPSTRTRQLMVESLESRAMLAGQVSVTLTDGTLRIVGDSAANDVEIQQIRRSFGSEWSGVTLEVRGHNGTVINDGQSSVTVAGVKAGVFIGLQGGDNHLVVGNTSKTAPADFLPVHLPGRVNIGTWTGDDHVQLNITNAHRVTVNLGLGADDLYMARSNLKNLTINSDPVPADGEAPAGAPDSVILRQVKADGEASIFTGLGDDEIKVLQSSRVSGTFTLHTGAGSDLLLLGATSFNDDAAITTGSGNDRLIMGVRGAPNVTVSLGAGDDHITLGGNLLTSLTLDGGADFDIADENASNDFGDLTVTNVEQNEL